MSQSSTETERTTTRTFDADAMKWVSGIVSLIGLWIAASPFIYETSNFSFWNNVAVGAAIFLIAGFTFYQLANGMYASVGVLSLVVLLGLWTIVAPFVVDFDTGALELSNVAAGSAVAILAGYEAYANRMARESGMTTRA
jgi:hypothetical protein